MKLFFEKHPDTLRLSQYFKKIESLAENMGVDVDELVHEQSGPNKMHMYFKRKMPSGIQKRRAEIFARQNKSNQKPESTLTVI